MERSEHSSMHAVGKDATPGEACFEVLFREHFRKLCHFAYQLVRDESVAKDISQDAFVSYWNHRQDVSGHPMAVRKFLYSTVKNGCLNVLRHDKVVNGYLEQQQPDPADEFTIIHAMVRSEVVAEVYRAIASLPENCRRISRMGYIEGLRNKEIASQLGVTVNTVKTQKKRGLQLLRLRLDPKYLLCFFF